MLMEYTKKIGFPHTPHLRFLASSRKNHPLLDKLIIEKCNDQVFPCNFTNPLKMYPMIRRYLSMFILLVLSACSENKLQHASDAEWKQWHSYLDLADAQPDRVTQFADSALIFARSHGMTDTGCYRPWELKARAARKEGLTDEALAWLDSIRLAASDRGHEAVEVRALMAIGQTLLQLPDWQLAEGPFQDALDLVETSDLQSEKPYVLYAWSNILRRSGKLKGAMDTLAMATSLFQSAGNGQFIAHALYAMGEIQMDSRDTLAAASYFRAAVDKFNEREQDRIFSSRGYVQLSALTLKKNPDSALFYFNASVAVNPGHQFPYTHYKGLLLMGNHFVRQQRPGTAIPFLDSAIQFARVKSNKTWEWNARLGRAVASLQAGNRGMYDSMMRSSAMAAMEGNNINEFTTSLRDWQGFFKGIGQEKSAAMLNEWTDPSQFVSKGNIPVAQPKTIREMPASRRASIQKRRNIRLAIGTSAFVLVVLGVWRIIVYRRNLAFLSYRERSEKLAADRKYRRDVLADTNNSPASEANRLVLDRECRVLAMEQLFEQERLHLRPDASFPELCKRLGENERSFRSVLSDMYDAEFELLLDEWRVEEAIRLLREGAKGSAIAGSCGFSDEKTFKRTFRKITGVTPARFLKMPMRPIR
jgi:AraC-like DNA-binding protein